MDSGKEFIVTPANFYNKVIQFKSQGANFITISSHFLENNEVSLNYFFKLGSDFIILNTQTDNKAIHSLYSIFYTSDFVEREISDVFGVKFVGHPNLSKL